MLVRHGYGVLLFDRRGEGESDGDPNALGWAGDRDLDAAISFSKIALTSSPAVSEGSACPSAARCSSTGLPTRPPSAQSCPTEPGSGRSGRRHSPPASASASRGAVLGRDGTAGVALSANDLPPPTSRTRPSDRTAARCSSSTPATEQGRKSLNPDSSRRRASPSRSGRPGGRSHRRHRGPSRPSTKRRMVAFFDQTLIDRD